jgi:hypothetical protein
VSKKQQPNDFKTALLSIGRDTNSDTVILTLVTNDYRLLAEVRMTVKDFGNAITGKGDTLCAAWVPAHNTLELSLDDALKIVALD